jgi:HrpA-like RNA helicase
MLINVRSTIFSYSFPGRSVGYAIGGEREYNKNTQIVFVTMGYLLQTVVNQPLELKRYSHIVLDEVRKNDIERNIKK